MAVRRNVWIAVRIAVSVLLLAAIFSRVDLPAVWGHLRNTRPGYFVPALVLGYFSQLFIGAVRYTYMLRRLCGIRIGYGRLLRDYWVGMFVGYFVPAGVGWDVYRIGKTYSRAGNLMGNTFVVLGEKVLGIVATIVMLAAVYPLAAPYMTVSAEIRLVARLVYWSLAGLGVATVAWLVVRKHAHRAMLWVEQKAMAVAARVSRRAAARLQAGDGVQATGQLSGMVLRFASPGHLSVVLGLTLLIRVASAYGGMCLFRAVGHPVPIVANLFAVPVLLVIFLLPISFGSLGVREGSTILIYGLFGVPKAVSLASSFLGLAALLTTVALGGVILVSGAWAANRERPDA